MDQQVVSLGHGVVTALPQAVAADPEQMRELRAWVAEHPNDAH